MHDDRIIIGDFGMSKAAASLTKTQCGTGYYMAPEVLDGRAYTNKADLWSIGITFYEMLFGKVPFEAQSPDHLKQVIRKKSGNNMIFPLHLNKISESCQNLIKGMLTEDPNKRLAWSSFFTHNIFLENLEQKSEKYIDNKDLKNKKEINESFFQVAKDLEDKKNDEITLKDPKDYLKENQNNIQIKPRVNTIIEVKTDQETFKT